MRRISPLIPPNHFFMCSFTGLGSDSCSSPEGDHPARESAPLSSPAHEPKLRRLWAPFPFWATHRTRIRRSSLLSRVLTRIAREGLRRLALPKANLSWREVGVHASATEAMPHRVRDGKGLRRIVWGLGLAGSGNRRPSITWKLETRERGFI